MSKSPLRRASLAGLATAAMVVSLSGYGVTAASADSSFGFTRIAGHNRFETAVAVAQKYGQSDNVILANGEAGHYPDALTANYLAGSKKEPILLTQVNTTPSSVSDYLKSSNVKNITIVGGPLAVSSAQQASLTAAGYTVTRIQGTGSDTSRYGTAKAVSAAVGGTHDTAVLSTGEAFPDAVASGPLSYSKQFPLTITKRDSLPQSTKDALTAAGVKHVVIAGGLLAVGQSVVDELKAMGIDVTFRAAGANRSDTSVKLAQYELDNYGFSNSKVNVASGEDNLKGADALSGGPLTGQENRALLITVNKDSAGASLLQFLTNHADTLTGTDNYIFGGPLAVSNIVEQQMQAAGRSQSGQSATKLPELVSAKVISTTPTNVSNSNNPAGTVVSYTFDEEVAGTNAVNKPVAMNFKVYSATDVPSTGNDIVSASGRTVTVRFGGITEQTGTTGANALSVATVVRGAVFDTDGNRNPEGDAALGNTTGAGTAANTAGITQAPDLVSVSGFRTANAGGGLTAVDFTFDQAATTTANITGFHLITTSGADLACTGPAANVTTTGTGLTVPGGNGTTTITVLCQPISGTTAVKQTDVARGTIDPATVQGTDTTPKSNVLQAADVSDGGNTTGPDLVSVDLRPSTNGSNGGKDAALFMFDEPISAATGTSFQLYKADDTVVNGTATAINPSDTRQVLVTFTSANALANVVGGNITDGAVAATAGGGNQQDEVGVAGTSNTTPGQTAGRTTGPDLTAVSITRGTPGQFGTPGDYQATYTFDEAVTSAGNFGYKLYEADGTELDSSNCAIGVNANGVTTNDRTVTCTTYTVASGGGNSTVSDLVGSATLGTVVTNAAGDVNGNVNPEGAEFTTGGTGTRTN